MDLLTRRIRGVRQMRGDVPAFVFSAVLIGALALENGGYFPTTWGWGTLLCVWVAGTCMILRPDVRVSQLGYIWVAAILALVAWTALSLIWSTDLTHGVYSVERDLLYLAAAVACLVIARRGTPDALLAGVLSAIVVTCCIGLAIHLFPDDFGVAIAPGGGGRLYLPLGYWNGTGAFAVFGILLGLGFTTHSSRSVVRGLAGASVPLLTLVVFLTYSRGAFVALGAGMVASLALESDRVRSMWVAIELLPWTIGVVVFANHESALTGAAYGLSSADEGHRMAVSAALACIGGGATVMAFDVIAGRVAISTRVRSAFVASLAVVATLAPAAIVVAHRDAVLSAPREVYDGLTSPPPRARTDQRLLNLSLNGRTALWKVAWRDFREHPFSGSGAGTYQQYWNRNRSYGANARWSHSLELEMLAEMGFAGGLISVAVLLLPGLAAVRSRQRAMVPAAAGACAAYIVHSAADWDWELPALTVTAFVCFAAIVVSYDVGGARPVSLRTRWLVTLGVVVLAVISSIALKGNQEIANSTTAAGLDQWGAAISSAHNASVWAPWSYEPDGLAASALLLKGDLPVASADYRAALSHGGAKEWGLWFGLAQTTGGSQQAHSIRMVLRLNPLSQELRSFCYEHHAAACPNE